MGVSRDASGGTRGARRYARHRTHYRRGGLETLAAEVAKDLARIATRNLGRDDRVVAYHGREARYPFLDENVVRAARVDLGAAVADLDAPPGVGCKRALRDAAVALGMPDVARLVKRAIQFGTRIAPFSNKLTHGSNRRADGADAFDLGRLLAGAALASP